MHKPNLKSLLAISIIRPAIVIAIVLLLLFPAQSSWAQKTGSIVGWGSEVVGVDLSKGLVAIDAGGWHSLALRSDGTIVGWGNDYYGQATPPAGNNFIAINAGWYHSLALRSDGTIVGWGATETPPSGNNYIAISAGGDHSLALKSDGTIIGWGADHYGQATPPDGNNFIAIAAGADHSLGLKSDGSIVAWGSNYDWNGNYTGQCNVPLPNTGFVAVAAGACHSLGLKQDGSIVAWGDNGDGQCNIPQPNTGFVKVAAGYYHSLGLKSDGSIVAWGLNYRGQCNVPSPDTGFVAVAGGIYHSLGLKSNGSVVAWGSNNNGQCNVPSPNTGFVAVAAGSWSIYDYSLGLKSDGSIVTWGYNSWGQCNVPLPNTGFVSVAAGGLHSLGLKSDGSIVAWGSNYDWDGNYTGQCNVPSPNTDFMAVAAGERHSLGLKADGSIVAWGWNEDGQCNVPSPNTSFVAIAAGDDHSLGLKADGSIVAWGDNYYGQCTVPSPNTGFAAIAAGGSNSLGLKSDGSIVAWGSNYRGQCNIPLPNADFIAVAAGGGHSLALKSDRTIVGWGWNEHGQATPAAGNNFIAISAGGYHSLGLKAEKPVDMTCGLDSTERIVSQIKGGFGKLPRELEQQFPAPIPDKDSPAGNYIFTSSGGLEGVTQTGDLGGRPVPVLSQMGVLGNGQPSDTDYISLIPIFGTLWDWVTKPRRPQDDPAQGDLRQRSILTGVNGVIRLNDFTGQSSLDLDVRFEFYGAARGYGLGTIQTTVEHGLMDGAKNVSGLKLADLFQKIVFDIAGKYTLNVVSDGALSFDSRFRSQAEASVCFGDPINKCFDCPVITPDWTQTYLWQGGGASEINSGLIWQGVDFQVTVPTNQDIPLLFELMTDVETAGYAYGGAGIERYRMVFTCPEIPEFGTHVIDSYDYLHPVSLEAANGQVQASGQVARPQGISFREVLTGAAGCEYLRTGLVSAKESLGGIQSPTGYPFAFVEGTEQSGLMFPVKIPRKPKKLVLLFDMFATHPVTPDEPIVVQFGLISIEEILLTKTIEASAFTYKAVPEPNGGYLVHTGWQEMVVDISDIPSSETMFCIAVDSNQAPANFGLAQSEFLIITEPALPGDFNADRIVDFADYAMLASYWLEENCSYPDWCGATDLDFTGRVDFSELSTIGSNWLRERIIGDFEPDGDVDFSDLMELANYWLSAESSLDIAPSGGDGRIDFRDFAELAKHWLKATR